MDPHGINIELTNNKGGMITDKYEKPCFPTNGEKACGDGIVECKTCVDTEWETCKFGKLHPDYAEYSRRVKEALAANHELNESLLEQEKTIFSLQDEVKEKNIKIQELELEIGRGRLRESKLEETNNALLGKGSKKLIPFSDLCEPVSEWIACTNPGCCILINGREAFLVDGEVRLPRSSWRYTAGYFRD